MNPPSPAVLHEPHLPMARHTRMVAGALWLSTALILLLTLVEVLGPDEYGDRTALLLDALDAVRTPLTVITGFFFLGWMSRARSNAEMISDRKHRWGYYWHFFGWLVPVLFFWVPRRIVKDIALGSEPDDPAAMTRLVNAWWAAYLAMEVGSWCLLLFYPSHGGRALDLLCGGVTVLAACYATKMITTVAAVQDARAARERAA